MPGNGGCRWHVLKNAKDRLGAIYSKRKAFKKEFNELLIDAIDKDKFEAEWATLLRRYHLTKNGFLKRLYKHRHNGQGPISCKYFVRA